MKVEEGKRERVPEEKERDSRDERKETEVLQGESHVASERRDPRGEREKTRHQPG